MEELKKEEMIKVSGGSNGILITSLVTAIITFIVGVFHGYANPKSCNN